MRSTPVSWRRFLKRATSTLRSAISSVILCLISTSAIVNANGVDVAAWLMLLPVSDGQNPESIGLVLVKCNGKTIALG